MIEGFARELPEDLMVEAILFAPRIYHHRFSSCSEELREKVGHGQKAVPCADARTR